MTVNSSMIPSQSSVTSHKDCYKLRANLQTEFDMSKSSTQSWKTKIMIIIIIIIIIDHGVIQWQNYTTGEQTNNGRLIPWCRLSDTWRQRQAQQLLADQSLTLVQQTADQSTENSPHPHQTETPEETARPGDRDHRTQGPVLPDHRGPGTLRWMPSATLQSMADPDPSSGLLNNDQRCVLERLSLQEDNVLCQWVHADRESTPRNPPKHFYFTNNFNHACLELYTVTHTMTQKTW